MLSATRLAASLLQQGLQQQATAAAGASAAAWFATKAKPKAEASSSSAKPNPSSSSAKASDNLIPAKDWKAIKLPAQTADSVPVTKYPGQAFQGDLRSTSGLGKGDGINNHTDKWLSGDIKSPLEYIQEAEPIKVSGPVVASYGSDDPALGCPVEYINLRGTSKENPAVCKYTGNKYYSDPHTWMAH